MERIEKSIEVRCPVRTRVNLTMEYEPQGALENVGDALFIEGLKLRWRELRRGEPGRRFRDRYQRRHPAQGGMARKCVVCVLGLLVVLAGIVLLPLPGPGMLIVAFGALLMAEGSLTVAKALDALELRARAIISRWRSSRRQPLPRSGSR